MLHFSDHHVAAAVVLVHMCVIYSRPNITFSQQKILKQNEFLVEKKLITLSKERANSICIQ